MHSDVLTVTETGTEAPDVAVDGAFSILVLGHESLAFVEDRANVGAGTIALDARDEGTTTNVAGGVASGNDAGVGIAAAFTMMATPRALQDLQPDEEEPADANDFESFGQVATAFAEGVASGISSNELLGGSAVRAFLGDASRALDGRARGGVEGAVDALAGLTLHAASGVGLWTLAVSGGDSGSTRRPSGGASTARGLDFGLGVSGDVAFSSLVNTAETYIRDIAAVTAATVSLEALNGTLGVTSAGALVFGDHLGISGAFARNGFFGTARSYTQDSAIATGELDVLATSAPVLLAFADSGSGARELLSLAGSVTKSDVTNLAEAFVGAGTDADVGDARRARLGVAVRRRRRRRRREQRPRGLHHARRRGQPRRPDQRRARVRRGRDRGLRRRRRGQGRRRREPAHRRRRPGPGLGHGGVQRRVPQRRHPTRSRPARPRSRSAPTTC